MEKDDFFPEGAGPPDEHGSDTVFFGPQGLRAGWGLLLFVFCVVILTTVLDDGLIALLHVPKPPGMLHETGPLSIVFSHGVPLLVMLGVAWMMARLERRRMGVYGLGGHGRLADCIKGLITGVVVLSLLVGVLFWRHLLVFQGFNVTGGTALWYGLAWLMGFCAVGIMEEFLFRGYMQYTLTRGLIGLFSPENPKRRLLAFWSASVLLSLFFLLGHLANRGETAMGLTAVFLVGLVLSYSLWRTGSLWWAIGFHTTWDWAQSFVYGVGDSGTISRGRLLLSHPQGDALWSGGPTGPEGSILILPTLLLLTVAIRFTVPKREQPPLSPELPAKRQDAAYGRMLS